MVTPAPTVTAARRAHSSLGDGGGVGTGLVQSQHNADIFLLLKMLQSNGLNCFQDVALVKVTRQALPACFLARLPPRGPCAVGVPPRVASLTPGSHDLLLMVAVVSAYPVCLKNSFRSRPVRERARSAPSCPQTQVGVVLLPGAALTCACHSQKGSPL